MSETFNQQFNWQRQPEAERLVLNSLEICLKNPFLSALKKNLQEKCSTGLLEWVDHIFISESQRDQAEKTGYSFLNSSRQGDVLRHLGAQLPDLIINSSRQGIGLHVDSIADFLLCRGMPETIEGTPFSSFRRALVSKEKNIEIWVVERRGAIPPDPIQEDLKSLESYFKAKEKWMCRLRSLENEDEGFQQAALVAHEMVALIGHSKAAALVLECERDYWQRRNLAGQIQKNRQDRLGMGWANHDHHTFRSSRQYFSQLVHLFEILGFRCRERYYTGAEAGWGAQIMENPTAKLVLFLDVDLNPDEVGIDFARETLSESDHLGTIGLWCALHGESILHAGMHHLEAQFNFGDLEKDLQSQGIKMMSPFSNFEYLKQAFTQGEMWPVTEFRLAALENKITPAEAERFRTSGAVGSHLENLQRKEGYKGFNQKNVSFIIAKTDPRKIKTSPPTLNGEAQGD